MTYCSFSSCSFFRFFSWVLRYPGFPLSITILRSSWVSRLPHSRLPPSSWILLLFLFFRASVVLSCDFFSTIYFSFGFYLWNFQCLPSLGTVSSVHMRCSFFLWVCGIIRLALPFYTFPILSMVSLPLSFLPVRHFPSFFGRSSDSVASPFPSATGSSLWAVLVRLFSVCAVVPIFQEYEEPVYSYSTYPGRR